MKLAFLLYDGMTALDMIGPHEILSRLPQAETLRVARHRGPVTCDSGVALVAGSALMIMTKAAFGLLRLRPLSALIAACIRHPPGARCGLAPCTPRYAAPSRGTVRNAACCWSR